jgi:hypothetical protein
MRKLSSEEETEAITFRARKTVLSKFRVAASAANFGQNPGKFFEVIFEEWVALKTGAAPRWGIPTEKLSIGRPAESSSGQKAPEEKPQTSRRDAPHGHK